MWTTQQSTLQQRDVNLMIEAADCYVKNLIKPSPFHFE